MSNGITLVADEFGIQREYTHVKRKALVGDRILIVSRQGGIYNDGDVLYVIYENRWTAPGINGTGVSASRTMRLARNWGDGFGVNHTEYVVPEPSDIVNIDGERFRTVSRKARIGELVSVIADNNSGHRLPIGSIQTIERVHEGTLEVKAPHNEHNFGWMERRDYTVLEPVAPASTPQPAVPSADELLTLVSSLAAQNVSLEKRVVSLEVNVAGHEHKIGTMDVQLRVAREDIVLIEEGAHDHITAVEKRVSSLEERLAPPQKTVSMQRQVSRENVTTKPTLSRQDVINLAKADVSDRFETFGDGRPVVDGISGHNTVEFIVNREKRTVVALLRLAYVDDGGVRGTGKSRCAPDDVFNVHIGKALALRRALGLPVPEIYTKSPQPIDVYPGDVVRLSTGGTYKCEYKHAAGTFTEKIIDDSRETAVSLC